MPLVTCPECRQSLSSAAPSCPHCGHPMTVGVALPVAAVAGAERELWKGSPSTTAMTGAILGWALFAILVTGGVFVLYGPVLVSPAGSRPTSSA